MVSIHRYIISHSDLSLTLGVEVGGLDVGGLAVDEGGYRVVMTVTRVVVVSREVYVAVVMAVPPFRMLLQNNDASAVCPIKASNPHLPTTPVLDIYSTWRVSLTAIVGVIGKECERLSRSTKREIRCSGLGASCMSWSCNTISSYHASSSSWPLPCLDRRTICVGSKRRGNY
jgi:hypothetical protein